MRAKHPREGLSFMKIDSLYSFTLSRLRDYLADLGMARFGADQVYDWVYRKYVFDPLNWNNVSKKIKDHFEAQLSSRLPRIVWQGTSSDGTKKFLLAFEDQQSVEAVVIPATNRLTLCLSTQVGCAIGCTFCHTGTMGLKRNLNAGEIVGQFLVVGQWLKENTGEKLTNIVYMGQGEPLHNFQQTKTATEIFLEQKGLGLGQRKITLSTSGLVPQIERLGEFPPVNVAISLHSARNDIRTELMPINKIYDLERLFQAIKKIPLKAHRRITYEYLLIDGLNNGQEDVEALSNLLHQKESKINLIPFNEHPGSTFKRPSNKNIIWFMDQMIKKGFTTTIRATKGQDILAACGQLKSHLEDGKLNLWESQKIAD